MDGNGVRIVGLVPSLRAFDIYNPRNEWCIGKSGAQSCERDMQFCPKRNIQRDRNLRSLELSGLRPLSVLALSIGCTMTRPEGLTGYLKSIQRDIHSLKFIDPKLNLIDDPISEFLNFATRRW